MVLNFAMSYNFEAPDFGGFDFVDGEKMRIDYIRLYQRSGLENAIGCDPPGFPTAEYINNHPDAYNNPNLTAWKNTGYETPLNSLYDGCP